MTLWQKLMALRQALNAGEELQNKATWKNAAMTITAISTILTALLPFIEQFQNVDPAMIEAIAQGVWGVVGLYNVYTHAATSTSVGFKPKSK